FDALGGTNTAGKWLTEYIYGRLDRSTTGSSGSYTDIWQDIGWYTKIGPNVYYNDRLAWSSPFRMDVFHCTNAICQNMILGGSKLYTSSSGGNSPWTATSGDLTKGNVHSAGA